MVTPVLQFSGDRITSASTTNLFVDQHKILEATNFITGLECLLASYWLFNTQYAPQTTQHTHSSGDPVSGTILHKAQTNSCEADHQDTKHSALV